MRSRLSYRMEELGKPIWWISVVVAGLLVNLASAYLKPRVDGALLRSSSWWRSKSQARIARRAQRIQAIRQRANYAREYAEFFGRKGDAILRLIIAVLFGTFVPVFMLMLLTVAGRPPANQGMLKAIASIGIAICSLGLLWLLATGLSADTAAVEKLREIREAEDWTIPNDAPSSSSAPPTEPLL